MKKTFIFIAFLIFLTGCGGVSSPGAKTKVANMANYQQAAGTAKVYFIRHHDWRQSAVQQTFYVDNQEVGTLADEGKGSWHFLAEIPAGVHIFNRKSHDTFGSTPHESRQVIEAGKSYCYGVTGASAYFRECSADEQYGQFKGFMKLEKKEESLW